MKKRIFLIVDDDIDDCDFFCEAVNEVDSTAECHTATNGEVALKKLRSNEVQPDYIFLDLNMPRMDGKTCLAELKKDNNLKNIPVIIYSTSSSQKDKDETRELGASHFITKPSNFASLRKQIASVMETDWIKSSQIPAT